MKTELLLAQKLKLVKEMEVGIADGASKHRMLELLSAKHCFHSQWLRRAAKQQEKLAEAVATRGKWGRSAQGARLTWTRLTPSGRPNKGLRMVGERGYLGKTDRLRVLKDKTKQWVQAEQARGHTLTRRLLTRCYLQELLAFLFDCFCLLA